MAKRSANAKKVTDAVKAKQAQAQKPQMKSAKAQGVPLSPQAVIVVNEKFRTPKNNPKRANTGAYKRFQLVQRFHNKTLAELTKEWKRQADQGNGGVRGYSAGSEIGWCIGRGFVTLKQPQPQKESKGEKRQGERRKSKTTAQQPAKEEKEQKEETPATEPANPAPAPAGGDQEQQKEGEGQPKEAKG